LNYLAQQLRLKGNFLLLFTFLIIGRPSSLLAVKKDNIWGKQAYSKSNKDLPKIPDATVLKIEKRAKNAIFLVHLE